MSQKCQTPVDWDAYEQACEDQQMSIEPTQFFGCNPYGNAAQIEHLREAETPVSAAGDDWMSDWAQIKDAASTYSNSSCEEAAEAAYKQRALGDANPTSKGEIWDSVAACVGGGFVGGLTGLGRGWPGVLFGAFKGCVTGIAGNEIQEQVRDGITLEEELEACKTTK